MSTKAMSMALNKQQRNWLKTIEMSSAPSMSMYPGMHTDAVPNNPARHLEADGYIERYVPHNPAHKDRWVITDAGRRALRQS